MGAVPGHGIEPLQKEVEKYLQDHPAVAKYLEELSKAQAVFGGYLRLAQPRIVLREISGASTADADLNATLSRTDH